LREDQKTRMEATPGVRHSCSTHRHRPLQEPCGRQPTVARLQPQRGGTAGAGGSR
jgi:hypothetical protein